MIAIHEQMSPAADVVMFYAEQEAWALHTGILRPSFVALGVVRIFDVLLPRATALEMLDRTSIVSRLAELIELSPEQPGQPLPSNSTKRALVSALGTAHARGDMVIRVSDLLGASLVEDSAQDRVIANQLVPSGGVSNVVHAVAEFDGILDQLASSASSGSQ